MSWSCTECGSNLYMATTRECYVCYMEDRWEKANDLITQIREQLKLGNIDAALKLTESYEPILTMEI